MLLDVGSRPSGLCRTEQKLKTEDLWLCVSYIQSSGDRTIENSKRFMEKLSVKYAFAKNETKVLFHFELLHPVTKMATAFAKCNCKNLLPNFSRLHMESLKYEVACLSQFS